MSRVVLAIVVTLILAGCGGGHRQAAQHCIPSAKQRRAVARASSDIRRLQRIEGPLRRYSDRGTPAQEAVTGKFLLDVTTTQLPVDVEARLLHRAKAAVGLCGLCFQGIEAQEPVAVGQIGQYARREPCH